MSIVALPGPSSRTNVPEPVRYFEGRRAKMREIEEGLTTGRRATLALCGPGGVGKTQLAIAYAHRKTDRYTASLWVKAEAPEALRTTFAELAGQLDLPQRRAKEPAVAIRAVLA